ncbi:hypothetical protein [Planctomyces sp. SH-PL14]|uniref:hypothetical protein n=1 Tax=Planctomyces sp. SH-PL14 TaxID=1632864 RepID=UPI00078E4718|nr:hypothetical protein [Planctomyces sp. SH-PL14]AMV18235.1 hypothetical protein VT03_10125 [Planctomyces sp. SH-PL14]
MKKLPAIQFYTGDWKKDPHLSRCRPATRGIWMDILCSIHDARGDGTVSGTVEQLSRECRCTPDEMAEAVEDLEQTGAAEVAHEGEIVTVKCRRMARKYRRHRASSENGKMGGRPRNPKPRVAQKGLKRGKPNPNLTQSETDARFSDDSSSQGPPRTQLAATDGGDSKPSHNLEPPASISTSVLSKRESISLTGAQEPKSLGSDPLIDDPVHYDEHTPDWDTIGADFIRDVWNPLKGSSKVSKNAIPRDLQSVFRECWQDPHWRQQADLAMAKFRDGPFVLSSGDHYRPTLKRFLTEPSWLDDIVGGTYDRVFKTSGKSNGIKQFTGDIFDPAARPQVRSSDY